MPKENTALLILADGRELAWRSIGETRGKPVFVFHGTPGSRSQFELMLDAALRADAHLIAVDRPGFGQSSTQPNRRIVDWPGDVAALADHLGISRFAVLGYSSGGPHALACAALLPDRVWRAAVVSGPGPLDRVSTKGMTPLNRLLVYLSRHAKATPVFEVIGALSRRWPEASIGSMFPTSADASQLRVPGIREVMIEDVSDAPTTAARAIAHEFWTLTHDWGFNLADVRPPVHIWHGSEDRNVPIPHARFLASRLPQATLHEVPGAGHLMLFEVFESILRSIT